VYFAGVKISVAADMNKARMPALTVEDKAKVVRENIILNWTFPPLSDETRRFART
jgi:hypothetical protein